MSLAPTNLYPSIMFIPTLLAALGLIAVHLFTGKLRFLEGSPRSIWLSSAGGISVSYVFLHLLPELARGQAVIEGAIANPLRVLEHHAYLIALLGLIIFYGLERIAKVSRSRQRHAYGDDRPSAGVFWLHLASFLVYNILVGYLLVNDVQSASKLGFFFVAMALHFLVTDYGLREHYKDQYARVGRWLLSAAVLAGWATGCMIELPELATSLLVAVLAGGVILNVLKEELPEERQSRFSAFLLGALAYAALLLAF